jgi:AcrR family transcriptional regulator
MKRAGAEVKPPRKPRGRPRSFDRESALAAAMEVFWEKGFEGASVAELCSAMELNPPSLYSAFGDKEKLFLEAVERYSSNNRVSCPYGDEPTARGAVEKMLTYAAHEFTETSEHPRGCLMMMASTTAANSSEALQKWIAQKRAAARDNLRGRIKQGIEEGDVPSASDASALADFYFTILTGMALQAREGVSRRSLLATVAQAMSLFPKAQKKKLAAAA